jgi:hypothetical protein
MGRRLSLPKSGRIRDFRGLSRKVDARYDNRTYLKEPDRRNADLPVCSLISCHQPTFCTISLQREISRFRFRASAFPPFRKATKSVRRTFQGRATDVQRTFDGRIVPSAFTDKRKIHSKSSPNWDAVSRDPNPVEYASFADYPEKSTPDTTAHI